VPVRHINFRLKIIGQGGIVARRFIICSPQEEYISLLADHIAERRDLAFELFICTTFESLLEEQQKKQIDILLIDGAISIQKRSKIKTRQTYVLTNGNQKISDQEKEVYQYQAANVIISEILEGCLERKDNTVFKPCRKGDKQLLAVYSPIHRIGKSEFAMTLARELGRHKQVLYVNLEEYSAMGEDLFYEKRNLSDLLYYMKQEEGYLGARVGTIVRKIREVDMIAPLPVSQDLKEVSPEDWEMLFHRLLKESMYETIVVDISESVQGLFRILNISDVIYMPTIQDPASRAKLGQYRQAVKQLGYETLSAKTVEVSMEQDCMNLVRGIMAKRKRRKPQ